MMNKPRDPENFNTYGLSLQFLDSINVQPPLVKKVFVANVSIIFKNFFRQTNANYQAMNGINVFSL